jgi:hypothetical protein
MATIDIGPGATNRASTISLASTARTYVDLNNPANDTGTLTSFEIFINGANALGVKMGTFSGSEQRWDDRDYESIGTVTYGSAQTFTGKNCDVSANDCLGIYVDLSTGSSLERDTDGYNNVCSVTGDKFGGGSNLYTTVVGDAISIYATGATAAAGNPYYYYLQQ